MFKRELFKAILAASVLSLPVAQAYAQVVGSTLVASNANLNWSNSMIAVIKRLFLRCTKH